MRVALTFRLYMMRYGIALLASSFARPSRTTFPEDILTKVTKTLAEKREVPANKLEPFKDYLYNKPGSPKYTPLRKAIEKGQPLRVEHQDLLLSDPVRHSSAGALRERYFDDALSLAHTLKLVKPDQNTLLTRGRLSLSTDWSIDDPYELNQMDVAYLGLWLLDVDCDWIWAFLVQLPDDPNFEITIENRVDLLLTSLKHVLSAQQIRSGNPRNAKIRMRLNELVKLTNSNVRKGLNLGQPWSWFLIPRLELLVDAGILQKKAQHALSGYSLTSVGLRFRSVCDLNGSGEDLINHYFFCRDTGGRAVEKLVRWEDMVKKLNILASELRTSVGYFPIFETASAMCVSQYVNPKTTNAQIWEIERVKEALWRESKSVSPRVRLSINRQGHIYAFKPEGKE